MSHAVLRQTLELRVEHTDAARRLRDAAIDLCLGPLAEILEEALDAAESDHGPVELDRLEIDLGRLPIDGFPEAALDAARRVLPDAISRQIERPRGADPGEGVRRGPTPRVLAFLASGHLPWWSPEPAPGALAAEFRGLCTSSPRAVARVLSAAKAPGELAQRVAEQFGRAALELLAEVASCTRGTEAGSPRVSTPEPGVSGAPGVSVDTRSPLAGDPGAMAPPLAPPMASASDGEPVAAFGRRTVGQPPRPTPGGGRWATVDADEPAGGVLRVGPEESDERGPVGGESPTVPEGIEVFADPTPEGAGVDGVAEACAGGAARRVGEAADGPAAAASGPDEPRADEPRADGSGAARTSAEDRPESRRATAAKTSPDRVDVDPSSAGVGVSGVSGHPTRRGGAPSHRPRGDVGGTGAAGRDGRESGEAREVISDVAHGSTSSFDPRGSDGRPRAGRRTAPSLTPALQPRRRPDGRAHEEGAVGGLSPDPSMRSLTPHRPTRIEIAAELRRPSPGAVAAGGAERSDSGSRGGLRASLGRFGGPAGSPPIRSAGGGSTAGAPSADPILGIETDAPARRRPRPVEGSGPAARTVEAPRRPPVTLVRGQPITVLRAGLVLLWPFLPAVFARLGYRAGDAWRGDGQVRAIHWLHRLGAGRPDAPEHDLVLGKLLCGLPVTTPVPRRIDLGDHEVQAANTLLADVVTHWSALKSTSPDGLRRGFIAREGLLTFLEPDWRLRVERRAHDILLERLPWPYGTVRLRWNHYTIGVTW